MEKKAYVCERCPEEKTLAQGEKIPECCGRPMVAKLEGCPRPFTAETARPGNSDEPCADGTDGNG